MPQVHIPPRNKIWWFFQQPLNAEVDKIQCRPNSAAPVLYHHWHAPDGTSCMHPAPASCTHFYLHTGTPLLATARHQEVVFQTEGSDLGSHLSSATLPMVRWLDILGNPARSGCHSGIKWMPLPPSYPCSSPDCQTLGPVLLIPPDGPPINQACFEEQGESFLSRYIST